MHARQEHGAIAVVAAREAERAFAGLARELIPPRGTVDLVLYDNVDFANGFTSPFPRNQVAVYLTSPASEAGLSRYDDWLRLVISHELTHVFHLDRSAGIWGVLQRVFGRAPGLFPNAYRPSWVSEGLAVYYESRLTEGGRLRSGHHAQVLAAAAAGHWPAPGDVNFASPKWPSGLKPYAFGSRFIDWESRTHGAEVVPRFVEITSRRLWPLEVSGPLARAGGDRLTAGWARFREGWAAAPAVGNPARILVRGLRVEPRPQVSPDGRWIAYVDVDGKRSGHVVVRDARTWAEAGRHLITGEVDLTWSGSELVISQLEFRSPVEIRSAIYRWGPGSPWRKASRVPRLTRPFALGPDEVAAVQLGTASATVVRIAADGVAPLAVPPAADWSRIAASPDGKWIAGARHRDARWDIALWPMGSPGEARRLTDDVALDEDPTWTPDGAMVVFASERLGLPQVFGVRIAGGEQVQFTREPSGAREPEVSPDGILYYSTILDDGYALLSRTLEATPPDAVPTTAAAAATFVPAPEIQARESGYKSFRALLPRWWWPLFDNAGTAGRFVGGVTSASDQVGRLGYRLGIAHGLDNARWEWAFGVNYSRWARFGVDAAASENWGSAGRVTVGGRSYSIDERSVAASLGGTLRWRRWRSDASIRLAGEIEQDQFLADPAAPVRFLNPVLGGGVVSFRVARFDSRALAISTENGIVVTGAYRRLWERDLHLWEHQVHGSVRAYLALPLPGFARWVLAGRAAGVVSGGTRTPRAFGLGGESSDIFTVVPGVSVGGGAREFPLRGYPRSPFGFTRVVVGAGELRIPVFLIGKGIPKLPLALDRVSLSLFGETGGGWAGAGPVNLTRFRDVGAELVTDWGVNYDTPLRVRAGVARGLTSWLTGAPGGTRWYVALGSAF